MLILSMNVDQKSLEIEFLIAICRLTGDKWQSKTLILAIFGPCSSFVKSVFDCPLSGVIYESDKRISYNPDSLVDKASVLRVGGRRFDSQCRPHWGSF